MRLIPNLQEQVASLLRRRILSGQLAPGTPFREQLLAAEFGVSRGPIRDALLALTKEGLLHARPNIGVRVAEEPAAFKRAVIIRLRREIESSALAAWFETMDHGLLTELGANLADYKQACAGTDFGQVVELDMAFHRMLVEFPDSGSLVDVWLPVISRMYLRYSRHRILMDSYYEHQAIMTAMQAGDKKKAVELLINHIV
jgi:DNA-binding GntR family transcriptional regulator